MPNILAYLMLAIWPVVALVLFRRLSAAQAVVWTLLAGYLLLPPPPAGFDAPLMPPLDKDNIPALAAFILALTLVRPKLRLWPENRIAQGLLVVFILSPAATWATNTAPVFFGPVGLPGMRPTEAVALMLENAVLVLPLLMGRAVLADGEGQRVLMVGLLAGGLVYALPMLIEVRLSPQLNLWVYGYFQHNFAQMIRDGGFRPIVFLYHGLWTAFFAMTAMVAGLALYRAGHLRERGFYLVLAGSMALVLLLCKSLASALYGAMLIPLVLLVPPMWQVRIAALAALLAFSYPVLKTTGLVPSDTLVAQAARIDQDRANSLQFRFDNEDILFARAQEKPVFGWGSWGRNQLHDPSSGAITTVTDGRWIITLGVYGWVGFLAEFGLLVLPLLALWREARRQGALVPALIGPMALLHAVNIIDLIPNATLTPLSWLVAGALLGTAGRMRARYHPPAHSVLETVL